MNPCSLTIHQLRRLLDRGEISSREVVEALCDRIADVDGRINAYITLARDEALRQADEADARLKGGGEHTDLLGIPIALKDLICTRGILTTAGSRILHNFVPPYDATVTKRLLDRGAVIIGKTNLDQFGMGSSSENSHYGPVRNPWNTEYIPGGSSGGSAVAVAADECITSLGTDTGGSIRQPASFCSVVGLKPTYGRVSRFGLIAYGSSFDQIGPLTKDVMDCAILMKAISGHDPMDSTSADVPVPDYPSLLNGDVKGLRIGVPKEYLAEGLAPEVEEKVTAAIGLMEEMGATVQEISLPHTEYAIATYYILTTAEASSNLARFDGVKYGYRTDKPLDLMDMYMKSRAEGFGTEVKRRIMLGTYALSAGYYEAYYHKAQQVRTLISDDFKRAFERVDVIVAPTSPTPPFKLGEKIDDPLQMYLSDVFTISMNLAGITALSLPCGFSKEGLPIGMQIMGASFQEEVVLKAAYAYEQNTEHHLKKPAI